MSPSDDEYTPPPWMEKNDDGYFADGKYADQEPQTWEEILASLWGAAGEKAGAVDAVRAHALVDPETLTVAGDTYGQATLDLQAIRNNIDLWTEALTGEDGSWKGAAATAFRAKLTDLRNHLDAHVTAMNGGVAGLNPSYRSQFYQFANGLYWARAEVKTIYDFYSEWARVNRKVPVENGVILVNHAPDVVAVMTDLMRGVRDTLNEPGRYDLNVAAPAHVDPTNIPVVSGPGGTEDVPKPSGANSPPKTDVSKTDVPKTDVPKTNVPKTDVPKTNVPTPHPAGDTVKPPSAAAGGGSLDIEPPPGIDLSDPPAGAGGGSGAGGAGGGAQSGGGSGLPGFVNVPNLNPSRPPAGLSGGGSGGAGSGLNVPKPAGGGSPGVPDGAGLGTPPAGLGTGDLVAPPASGGVSLGGDLPAGLGSASGAGAGGGAGMPPMTPMSPPAGAGAGPDRSDAAGLVNAGSELWEHGEDGLGAPDASAGAVPVGAGSQPPPPMTPMSPPAGTGSGPERSDASGLVGAGKDLWERAEDGVGAPDASAGAVPVSAGSQPPPPMTPMSPPAGAAAGPERSNAAALIGAGSEAWEPAGDDAGAPDAPTGAQPAPVVAQSPGAATEGRTPMTDDELWLSRAPVTPAAAIPPVAPPAAAPSTAPVAVPAATSAPSTAPTAAPAATAGSSTAPTAASPASAPNTASPSATGPSAAGPGVPPKDGAGTLAPTGGERGRDDDAPVAAVMLPGLGLALPRERERKPDTEQKPDAGDENETDPEDAPDEFVPIVAEGDDDRPSWDESDLAWDGDEADRDDPDPDDPDPDDPDSDDPGWGHLPASEPDQRGDAVAPPDLAAWRRRRTDPGTVLADDTPQAEPEFRFTGRMMSDEELAEYWAEADGEDLAGDEAEPAAERRALDLLQQDRNAWLREHEDPGVIG